MNTVDGRARGAPRLSFAMSTAVRISRARWFRFLRRVFQYQNGSSSDLGSNPFNSGPWLALELMVLVVQITVITVVLALSQEEEPVWPLRVWIVGYDVGCLLSLPLLYWRHRCRRVYVNHGDDGHRFGDIEQQRDEESRSSYLMNKSRSFLELFFALWFVMGNVWVFDTRFGSFNRSPNLHILCIVLLAWNTICYSFPFILFVLLCCCVPLINNFLGYNMNLASANRGATDDQLSQLPSWRFKVADDASEEFLTNGDSECCICLANYRDSEEVRQLPCSHLFHLGCVDQWLRIISCCPLCKKEIQNV
ncbi:E3 ubiquitin-protein ligase [Acorus calamus]|uniref:E3 ubiquitin-protein ligase n=1 Tax=Acorus calamus TaxID=4465 RepID=A0AAV9ECU5_ACOCL|nr:E3 ubiquitin-protein ligase [Acorus calamus]